MGKPFVDSGEPEPRSRRSRKSSGSSDVSIQNGKLKPVSPTPMQDALHTAETYLQEVHRSSSSNPRVRPRRTLLDVIVDDTQKSGGVATARQRKAIGANSQGTANPELSSEANCSVSPAQANIDLQEPIDFSGELFLDDSGTNLSSPADMKSVVSPTQADIGADTPSKLSLDDSDSDRPVSMFSPPVAQSSDEVWQQILRGNNSSNVARANSLSLGLGSFHNQVESPPQGGLHSPQSPKSDDCSQMDEGEHSPDRQHVVSNGEFEWNAILRRSGRSLDSLSEASFKTSKTGMSSTSSKSSSLSEEAISERAAAWGSGVAKLVVKNCSHESTPRTSDGSLADGLPYGQCIPGLSKHIKDTLSAYKLAFVVSDAADAENLVLYASAGFFDMTGYSPDEVIGRNCRFLQGVDTDVTEVAKIRKAVKQGEAYSGTILNYKKNGTPFWNQLTLSPMTDDKGVVIKYMGMQAEVSGHTMASRRKKAAQNNDGKDVVPRSICESIAEIAPADKSDREDDVPSRTLPASKLAARVDRSGRCEQTASKQYSLTHGVQGSKRYSLTIGAQASKRLSSSQGRSRSVEFPSGAERPVGGSRRHAAATGKVPSLGAQQRPSKTSLSARPLYWLMTAVRILEEELSRLGCDPDLPMMCAKPSKRPEERKGGMNKNSKKTNQAATGFLGFFRKLERKVFKRKSSAPAPSSRVNAYDFESDVEIDDLIDGLPEIGARNNYYESQRQDLHCESMPHIRSNRGGSASSSVFQEDFRARSSRYFSSGKLDRFDTRHTVTHKNETFRLDREQFCIIHE